MARSRILRSGKAAKTIEYLNRLRENRISINPPRKILLKFWLLMIVSIFFLLAYSYNVFLFITVPLIGLWVYAFNYFIRTWRAFGYSRALVMISVIAVSLIAVVFGGVIRRVTVDALTFILDVRN